MNKHTKELGERLEKLLQWPGDVKIDTKVPDILQLLKELGYRKVIEKEPIDASTFTQSWRDAQGEMLESGFKYCEPIEL